MLNCDKDNNDWLCTNMYWRIEMGRMSDYDIRPKPKVWAGSPNEVPNFGRMLCARMKQRLLLESALSS